MSKKKFQFTNISARMNLILLFEDTRLSAYLDLRRREPGNEQDCNAVTVMYEDRVVGHIPLAISKCISLFLTLPGSFLETKVTGKRINRGGGYGLEVPCKYRISGQEKV